MSVIFLMPRDRDHSHSFFPLGIFPLLVLNSGSEFFVRNLWIYRVELNLFIGGAVRTWAVRTLFSFINLAMLLITLSTVNALLCPCLMSYFSIT